MKVSGIKLIRLRLRRWVFGLVIGMLPVTSAYAQNSQNMDPFNWAQQEFQLTAIGSTDRLEMTRSDYGVNSDSLIGMLNEKFGSSDQVTQTDLTWYVANSSSNNKAKQTTIHFNTDTGLLVVDRMTIQQRGKPCLLYTSDAADD